MNRNREKLVRINASHVCQFAIFCVLLTGALEVVAQQQIPAFSADQVQVTRGKTKTAKVYSSEKGVRLESNDQGKPSITIMRMDEKSVWILDPAQKTYMDMAGLGAMGMEMATAAKDAKVEKQPMGSEQVGEYHCDKFHVQTTLEGHVYKGIEWDAKELNGFPVKQAGEKGEWSKEYQNVKLGPQDPSLFEIPPGYKKIDIGLGGLFKPKS